MGDRHEQRACRSHIHPRHRRSCRRSLRHSHSQSCRCNCHRHCSSPHRSYRRSCSRSPLIRVSEGWSPFQSNHPGHRKSRRHSSHRNRTPRCSCLRRHTNRRRSHYHIHTRNRCRRSHRRNHLGVLGTRLGGSSSELWTFRSNRHPHRSSHCSHHRRDHHSRAALHHCNRGGLQAGCCQRETFHWKGRQSP